MTHPIEDYEHALRGDDSPNRAWLWWAALMAAAVVSIVFHVLEGN